MSFTVPKIQKLRGSWKAIGDKSISHRALLLASLAQSETIIENFLKAEDCVATARALKMMGIEISEDKDVLTVYGKGLHGLKKPSHVLDVGNSGTTLRLLTGILSAQKFSSVITGDHSLVRRPMKELIQLLRHMGVNIDGHEENYAPIHIYPLSHPLNAIFCEPTVPSAQIKSSILLAGLYAQGMTEVKEPISTRDHTERLLKYFGVDIKCNEGKITLLPSSFEGQKIMIPGDISSASYLMALAMLHPDSEIEIEAVGLNPTRTGFIDILKAMGADIETEVINDTFEPVGKMRIKSSLLRSVTISHELTIRAIDELPLIALLATQAHGETHVSNASSLKYKESNRLMAITQELSRMGASIQETNDGWIICGPTPLKGTSVKSYHDHRIAMTLMVAGSISQGEVEIDDIDSIQKSFPSFLQVIQTLSKWS